MIWPRLLRSWETFLLGSGKSRRTIVLFADPRRIAAASGSRSRLKWPRSRLLARPLCSTELVLEFYPFLFSPKGPMPLLRQWILVGADSCMDAWTCDAAASAPETRGQTLALAHGQSIAPFYPTRSKPKVCATLLLPSIRMDIALGARRRLFRRLTQVSPPR